MINKLLVISSKFLKKETISYLIFGVLTTLVDIVIFFICNKVCNIEYILATLIAWILAVLFAYVTNKFWVFNSKSLNLNVVLKETITFFIARFLSLGFTIIWMFLTVEILHVDEFISKLLVNIFVVLMNYLFSKLIIFKKNENIE